MKFQPDKKLKITSILDSLGRGIQPKVYQQFAGVSDTTANVIFQFVRDESMILEITTIGDKLRLTVSDHKQRIHLIAEE